VLYKTGSFEIVEQRFEKQDLADMTKWWQDRLRESVGALPCSWMDDALARLPPGEKPS